jgi:hypothetical protein
VTSSLSSESSTCGQHASTFLQQLREVWTKNFKTSPTEGDGEDSEEPSRDQDDFEKQMRLANESDKTAVRASPS